MGGRFAGHEGGFLDPDEWSADIAELVCEQSAVIRLGATVAFGVDELQIRFSNPFAAFRAPGTAGPAPAQVAPVTLRPGDHRLEASVTAPAQLMAELAANPYVAFALKSDLAGALAVGADRAFLIGVPGGPRGVSQLIGPIGPALGLLQRLRGIVDLGRASPVGSPGWVLQSPALQRLNQLLTTDGRTAAPPGTGRTIDTLGLLEFDGADGGTLLGLPFVTTRTPLWGGETRVYFAADWQEAWIGFDPSFVTVATGAPAAPGNVVITASMPLDFALRRSAGFAWTVA